MNRPPILTPVTLRISLLVATALALALVSCSNRLSEDRVRTAIPGTWVGTFVPTMGASIGVPRRMEFRIFNNGQYHFLLQGSAGLEVEHAGTWSVQSGENGVIYIVGSGAPSQPFEVINLRMLHLFYQGTTVEFTRQ